MIVTVTLNAALDRSLTVPIFKLGHRHRASSVLALAGGKGINVARALKRLDVPVVATGLAGGRTGTRIVEELTEEAILNDFVRIRDESRTSTAVVDPTAGTYTEINEWGPKVSESELAILLDKLRYLSRGASTVVFAGSLPRGVDEGFYADAVREMTRLGARVVLDAEGEPLRRGIEAEPWLVSPNQHEAEQLVGQELEEDDDFVMALDTIAEMGARNVHITLETGCFALVAGRAAGAPVSRRAPQLDPVSVSERATSCWRAGSRRTTRDARGGVAPARGRRRLGVGARGGRGAVRPKGGGAPGIARRGRRPAAGRRVETEARRRPGRRHRRPAW